MRNIKRTILSTLLLLTTMACNDCRQPPPRDPCPSSCVLDRYIPPGCCP